MACRNRHIRPPSFLLSPAYFYSTLFPSSKSSPSRVFTRFPTRYPIAKCQEGCECVAASPSQVLGPNTPVYHERRDPPRTSTHSSYLLQPAAITATVKYVLSSILCSCLQRLLELSGLTSCLPDQYTPTNTMSGRKRKAEDELPDRDRMSFSPSPSPSGATSRIISQPSAVSSRMIKRPRTNVTGRPLALPRLLETLSADEMRSVLNSICMRHPDIGSEIVNTAPRPSVQSALSVLRSYQTSLRASFPYGDRPTSEYAFNRVKASLTALIEALNDFTPHFLPPHETQVTTSLEYVDAATSIIHGLPNWESFAHDRYKHDAYDEIGKGWACIIKEAAKRGGGIQLQLGGWDQKLAKHDELSGGRLRDAILELRRSCGYIGQGMGTGMGPREGEGDGQGGLSVRDQLLSGSYGVQSPIQVGTW